MPGTIPDPLPSGAVFDRAAIAAASNEILDCSSGSVVLEYAGSFAIKGDCASVTLTGDATVLTADHIGTLRVRGYGHIVLVASVDMGYHFGCALLVGGELKCWGINAAGTLGLGDEETRGDGPGEMGDALPTVKLLGP